jgi:hypothetical protein
MKLKGGGGRGKCKQTLENGMIVKGYAASGGGRFITSIADASSHISVDDTSRI